MHEKSTERKNVIIIGGSGGDQIRPSIAAQFR